MMKYSILFLALFFFAGCGKKNTGTSSLSVSLNTIPSADGIVKASTSAQSFDGFRGLAGVSLQASVPHLVDINSTNADTYFWNGLVATINSEDASAITSDQKNEFWGNVVGGPAGNGACYLSQAVAQSFSNLLNNSNSTCYMKGMSSLSGNANLFAQAAGDVITQVKISNLPKEGNDQGPTSMDVFLDVYGSKTVGSDIYKVQLYMCAQGVVNQKEIITVDKVAGTLTDESYNVRGSDNFYFVLTANLVEGSDGTLSFDLTKDRIAKMVGAGSYGHFGGYVDVGGNNEMTIKMYSKSTYQNNTWSSQNYAKAAFTGTGLSDLAFGNGAAFGLFSDGTHTNTMTMGTAFNGSYYAAVNSGELYDAVSSYAKTYSSDDFWTFAEGSKALDATGLDCGATPAQVVDMDFSTKAVSDLQKQCENHNRITDYNICQSSAVQSAQQKLWSH